MYSFIKETAKNPQFLQLCYHIRLVLPEFGEPPRGPIPFLGKPVLPPSSNNSAVILH